jgi:[acyl-carrier-protein] S-malonyltransferase
MTFAVLCPGQGAQHAGIFDRVRDHAGAQGAIDRARDALGVDPRAWAASGDLFANRVAQPLLCVAQFAQWVALRDGLPAPAALAGLSVGELACYGLAGALDAGALARLALDRALAMDAAAAARPCGLLGVTGLRRAALTALLDGAEIAIAAADAVFVVGGADDALAALRAAVERRGARASPLRVGVPSHTSRMAAAVPAFRAALDGAPLRDPARPVVAGIDARPVATRTRAVETLASQVAHTIEWGRCLDALHERGCRVFLELAPGSALSAMVRERFDDVEARGVEEFHDLAAAAAWVRRRVPSG